MSLTKYPFLTEKKRYNAIAFFQLQLFSPDI